MVHTIHNLETLFFQVMKNSDQIFDSFDSLTFMEDMDTSVFAFRPSMDIFKALLSGTKTSNGNKGTLEKYLKVWNQNQHKKSLHLDPCFNREISFERGNLLG